MRDASFILGRAGSRVLAVMLLAAATALSGCAGGGGGAANSYAMAPSTCLLYTSDAADDLVLRKIAQAGFSGLSNMINGTPEAPNAAPGLRGPAVASAIPAAPAREMPASALGYAEQ